jgi:hypothetical protein
MVTCSIKKGVNRTFAIRTPSVLRFMLIVLLIRLCLTRHPHSCVWSLGRPSGHERGHLVCCSYVDCNVLESSSETVLHFFANIKN